MGVFSDSSMRSEVFAVLSQAFDLGLSVIEIKETALIGAFKMNSTREFFSECIVCRLPRTGEVGGDIISIRSEVHFSRSKLGTTIATYRFENAKHADIFSLSMSGFQR